MSFFLKPLIRDGEPTAFGFALGLVEKREGFTLSLLASVKLFCVKWSEGETVKRLLFRNPKTARQFITKQITKG